MPTNNVQNSYQAKHRWADVAPRKMRPFADLIRGRRADDALEALRFLPNRSARLIESVLRSALSNAENRGARQVDDLVVVESRIDNGATMKRLQPRARGTAYPIKRRYSHIIVSVGRYEESDSHVDRVGKRGLKKGVTFGRRPNRQDPILDRPSLERLQGTKEDVLRERVTTNPPKPIVGVRQSVEAKVASLRALIDAGETGKLMSHIDNELSLPAPDNEWLDELMKRADDLDIPEEPSRRKLSAALLDRAHAVLSQAGATVDAVSSRAIAATLRRIGRSAPVDMAGRLLPFVESVDRDVSQMAMNSLRTLFSAEAPSDAPDLQKLREAVARCVSAASEGQSVPANIGYLGCAFEADAALADPSLPDLAKSLASLSKSWVIRFISNRLETVRADWISPSAPVAASAESRLQLVDLALANLRARPIVPQSR